MDYSELVKAFMDSIGADADSRKQAQQYLDSIKSASGLIPALVALSLSDQQLEVRQMAVIFLKNTTKIWRDSSRSFVLPPEDKDYLRLNIIHCLRYSIPEKVRTQFEEIAFHIAGVDFPWEQIFSQIEEKFQENTADSVYSALMMIFQIGRTFEFVMSRKRANLSLLVSQFFPRLQSLLASLLLEGTEDSFRFASLVLHTYWVCTYIEISAEQASSETLGQWLASFKRIIEIPAGPPIDDSQPLWQCKRWAMQLLHRFFNRYANPAVLKDHTRQISECYLTHWAGPVLESVLPQLLALQSRPATPLVINYFLRYTAQALKHEPTQALVLNHTTTLVTDVIMNMLKLVPEDETLWRENPIEYVRKEADLRRAYYSPKTSTLDLLGTLCDRGAITSFLLFASEQLPTADLLTKEALLLAIGSLQSQVRNHPDLATRMEPLLQTYVLPEFDSTVGFLRARACWTYAQLASFPFRSSEHQTQALQKLCSLALDPELPVKVQAAIALPKLFIWDVSRAKIGGEIKRLLEIYLEIMGQIDSEELVDSLEDVIGKFSNEIVPFALELVQHLVNHFLRMVRNEDTSDSDSAMAAVSTLNTIGKIVDALEERPEDLQKASMLLGPVFEFALGREGCEYFEEVVHLLTCLLYYAPKESLPHLFPLLQLIKEAAVGAPGQKEYAGEHVEETFSVIGNFVSKYPNLALQQLPLLAALLEGLLAFGNPEKVVACKLGICLMENLPGHVDSLVQALVAQISGFLFTVTSKSLRAILAQVILVSFWYNAPLALSVLETHGHTQAFIQYFLSSASEFDETMAKTYSLFGLGSLLKLTAYTNPENPMILPPVISSQTKLIAKTFVSFAVSLRSEDAADTEATAKDHYEDIINKLKEREMARDDEESFRFGTEAEDLYDSPFEIMDSKGFVEEVLSIPNIVDLLETSEQQLVREILY